MSAGPYDEYHYEITSLEPGDQSTYSIVGWDDDTDDEPPTDDADAAEDGDYEGEGY
jgi:hypothetical protein